MCSPNTRIMMNGDEICCCCKAVAISQPCACTEDSACLGTSISSSEDSKHWGPFTASASHQTDQSGGSCRVWDEPCCVLWWLVCRACSASIVYQSRSLWQHADRQRAITCGRTSSHQQVVCHKPCAESFDAHSWRSCWRAQGARTPRQIHSWSPWRICRLGWPGT